MEVCEEAMFYAIYYADFSEFKEVITTDLNKCDTPYKPKLDSLLTLCFQSYKKLKVIP